MTLFLGQIPPSPYDLHFHVAGIPVRVHPFFWLGAVLLGGLDRHPAEVVMWVAVVFLSILVHELGHALSMRRFGQSPHIVLHMVGGYASADADVYSLSFSRPQRLTHARQIMILMAGPGAGFLLAALIMGIIVAAGGEVRFRADFPWFWSFALPVDSDAYARLYLLVFYLLFVNIMWGLFNLLPIYPLDGGQIVREVWTAADPGRGITHSLYVSLAAAVLVAIAGLSYNEPFLAIMFGYFAFMNYQSLQRLGGGFGNRFGGDRW